MAGVDTREAILARLRDVLAAVVGEGHAQRNEPESCDVRLPSAIVLDADEAVDDSGYGRGRSNVSPVVVTMTPEIYVKAMAEADTVGRDVNQIRAQVIKAVLTDKQLIALCHNGDIRYLGCATQLARGREMIGECAIAFAFNYLLRPDQL